MPRKSVASLMTPVAKSIDGRVPPPDTLTADQALRWEAITATKPASWLTDDAIGLLTELVRAESESQRVAGHLMEISAVDVLTRDGMSRYTALCKMADLWAKQQSNLARALRLTPHSRITPKAAGTNTKASGTKPWDPVYLQRGGES